MRTNIFQLAHLRKISTLTFMVAALMVAALTIIGTAPARAEEGIDVHNGLSSAPPAPVAKAPHGEAAAHGEGHATGPSPINWFKHKLWSKEPPAEGPLFFAILNFAILAFLLVRFSRTPLKDYLHARHVNIQQELEIAQTVRQQAETKLAEIEMRTRNIDQEINRIKETVAAEAEREKQNILKSAEEEAARLLAQSQLSLNMELRRAHQKLEQEVVEAASKIAESMIKQKLTSADHQRLMSQYLSDLTAVQGEKQ